MTEIYRKSRPAGSHSNSRSASLDLTLTARAGAIYVPFIRKHLRAAHSLLKPALCELSVALVGDARMSSLHEQFMNIAGPTDVLTFPLDFDDEGREIGGEVVICVPEAARQAKRLGTRVDRELLLYALHGMLHLSGFDDRTASGFRHMHRKEDEILIHLGMGRVFATPENDGKAHGPCRPDQMKPARANRRLSRKRPRASRALGAG